MRFYGQIKDPYRPTDRTMGAAKKVCVPDADLTVYCPEPQDQLAESSCVANALEEQILSEAKKKNIMLGDRYSRTHIYNAARFLDGTLQQDCGTYASSGYKGIQLFGALQEHLWPYNPPPPDTNFDMRPPGTISKSKADVLEGLAPTRIVDGVDGILAALASQHTVALGIPWPCIWEEPGPDGMLSLLGTTDELAGGHEILACQSIQEARLIKILNSWSKRWAKGGFAYIPFSAFDTFKAMGGYDAHIINFDHITVPTQKKGCMFGLLPIRARETCAA